MELQDLRERILNTPVVQSMPEKIRTRFCMALLWVSESQEVTLGEHLFLKGDQESDAGCILLLGSVEIYRQDGTHPVTVQAPDILGEMHLFSPGGQRTATVEVSSRGSVLRFEWQTLAKTAAHFLSKEEMATVNEILKKCAWKRDPGLFPQVGSG